MSKGERLSKCGWEREELLVSCSKVLSHCLVTEENQEKPQLGQDLIKSVLTLDIYLLWGVDCKLQN